MGVKKIRVKNFKSFKDAEARLGNFNVLIGANSSGKSNFIRVFEFLRDIQRHGLDNAISLQGGPEYITNLNLGPNQTLSVEVVLSAEQEEGPLYANMLRGVGTFQRMDPFEVVHSFSIRFPNKRAGFEVSDDRLAVRLRLESPGRRRKAASGKQCQEIVATRRGDKVRVTMPDGEPKGLGAVLERRLARGSLILEGSSFFLPLSFAEMAIYDFDPKLPKKATPITGKAELEEDGSNLAIVLKRIIENSHAKRKLANFLKDVLPFVTGMDVERFADKSLLFSLRETYAKNKPLPASLISDGTINITALIVALYFEKKPICVIEEPERNMHPYLLSRIAGMMKDASSGKQIIITTHNPELVRNADIEDVLLISREPGGFSIITRPSENKDVKVFLQNEMGLDELFAQNLLHT